MWPFPKRVDFFKLLSDQTAKVEEGLDHFLAYLKEPTAANAEKVYAAEKEADELRRVLIDELNRSFVTPIDREDIFALSRAIDDTLDYAYSTVKEMILFDIKPDIYIIDMAEALDSAANEISCTVRHLRDNPGMCAQSLINAKKGENFIEYRYREGLAELFKKDDYKLIFKTREVYRHLSNAADRVAQAADIVADIVVKTT